MGRKGVFSPPKQHYCPMLGEGGCNSSLGMWHRVFLWLQGFGVPMALGSQDPHGPRSTVSLEPEDAVPTALRLQCPHSPRM